jgi:phage tail-like protein
MFDALPVGFHFVVVFELLQGPSDIRFQEVSGLNVSTEFESLTEGGENRFTHQLPTRLSFGDITLKRSSPIGSSVSSWARKAMENFEYQPVNVMISLLDANHLPLRNWYVVNAVPKQLDISGFNAMNSELVIETLTLSYHYFTYTDPMTIAGDVAGAVGLSI